MTEKRFTYEYDEYNGNLFDNKMNTFYHIEDSDENIEVLCDRLNWLVEENEQLKQRITTQSVDREQLCKRIDEVRKENEHLKEEIKDLNDILARYEERVLKKRTNHNEKDCGHCKHLQIDGMFGMWCEKKHNWTEVKYCKDYER